MMLYFIVLVVLLPVLRTVDANGIGIYGAAYERLPIGITFIRIFHNEAGPIEPNMKWYVECFNGEGLIGIQDNQDDFEILATVKCRALFPELYTRDAIYPYYDGCFVRNLTMGEQYYCFDGTPETANSFAVALWSADRRFDLKLRMQKTYARGEGMKCCHAPPGYVIDHGNCHYRFTHDEYFEFYDTPAFVVVCPDWFLITGVGIIKNGLDEDWHWGWIQCCPYYRQPGIAPILPAPAYEHDSYGRNDNNNNYQARGALLHQRRTGNADNVINQIQTPPKVTSFFGDDNAANASALRNWLETQVEPSVLTPAPAKSEQITTTTFPPNIEARVIEPDTTETVNVARKLSKKTDEQLRSYTPAGTGVPPMAPPEKSELAALEAHFRRLGPENAALTQALMDLYATAGGGGMPQGAKERAFTKRPPLSWSDDGNSIDDESSTAKIHHRKMLGAGLSAV